MSNKGPLNLQGLLGCFGSADKRDNTICPNVIYGVVGVSCLILTILFYRMHVNHETEMKLVGGLAYTEIYFVQSTYFIALLMFIAAVVFLGFKQVTMGTATTNPSPAIVRGVEILSVPKTTILPVEQKGSSFYPDFNSPTHTDNSGWSW